MSAIDDPSSLLATLLDKAKKAGADAADAIFVNGISLSTSYRLGKPEGLERSEWHDLGLRVLLGQQQAMVSTTDFAEDALDELVSRAIAMAGAVPEDPFCGLIEPSQLARDWPDLELADTGEPGPEKLIEWARRAEEAARAVPGVTNSEGGDASWGRSHKALATSGGFSGSYESSSFSFSVSVLAGEDTGMERDYDWSSACFEDDLGSPEEIGKNAGEGAVRRLNPRKAPSGPVPVVYDPRVSGGLIRHLSGAISGDFQVYQAMCERYGIVNCTSLDDMIDAALAFQGRRFPAGPAIAFMTTSGGTVDLLHDVAEAEGAIMPALSEVTVEAIRPLVNADVGIGNPIDTGSPIGATDISRPVGICKAMVSDPSIDMLAWCANPPATEAAWRNPEMVKDLLA
ncbi:MAG: Metalloprotease PmbA, partial [Alphaproteobacteria bacterium MarineAlpha10_Bin1]